MELNNQNYFVNNIGVLATCKKFLLWNPPGTIYSLKIGTKIKIVGCDEYKQLCLEINDIHEISRHKRHKDEKRPIYFFISKSDFQNYLDSKKIAIEDDKEITASDVAFLGMKIASEGISRGEFKFKN